MRGTNTSVRIPSSHSFAKDLCRGESYCQAAVEDTAQIILEHVRPVWGAVPVMCADMLPSAKYRFPSLNNPRDPVSALSALLRLGVTLVEPRVHYTRTFHEVMGKAGALDAQ